MKRNESKLRALVLEDELPARNYLVELIEATGLAEVVGAIATIQDAREVIQAGVSGAMVDVFFVDIQIVGDGDRAGLDLVRELVGEPNAPAIVLATAFAQHALAAFDLGVIDYLLKPFHEERVLASLQRVSARRSKDATLVEAPARIVARRGKSLVFLEPSDVWAFEAADRLTCVHTSRGTFDVDLSLSTIEASLGKSFARVHRNWLVSSAHVMQLDRDGTETTLVVGANSSGDGARQAITVPVARERAQGVRELLLENAMGVRRL